VLQVQSRNAFADAARYFVGERPGDAREIFRGNFGGGILAVPSQQGHLVAYLDTGNGRHIDQREIHRDATDNGRKRAAHSRSRLQIPSPGKAEDLRFPIDRTACPRQMPPSRNETGPRLAGM